MSNIERSGGGPLPENYRDIDPLTGQQKAYVVLSPEERAKGFVRPVRRSYQHVGHRPKHTVRSLTPSEREMYGEFGYVLFEMYPESEAPKTGRFWTQAELDQKGCGAVTTMSQDIAETYARNPRFYGGTFCIGCGTHLPVAGFVWDGTDEVVGT